MRSITFDLAYDPALLTIDAIEAVPGGPAVTITTGGSDGALQVTLEFAAPIAGAGAQAVANIRSHVPATAPYGAQQVLDLGQVVATLGNGSTSAGIDDDALHVVGFLGDTDGNQGYNARDPFLLQYVFAGRDSGFGAWALTDPTIVGDVTPAAGLNVRDILRLQQQVALSRANPGGPGLPEFPLIPQLPVNTLSMLALTTSPAPAPARRRQRICAVPRRSRAGCRVSCCRSRRPARSTGRAALRRSVCRLS